MVQLFACLRIAHPHTSGLVGRLRKAVSKPNTELYSASALGKEYLVVSAEEGRHGFNWTEIAQLLRPFTRCLLTPSGVSIPSGVDLTGGPFPAFERRVLLQTATTLVEQSRMPVYRRVLGIYDPLGLLADELLGLLRHFASARVVTQALSLYQTSVASALEELGAPVMLGTEPSDFADCVLLLCPAPVEEPLPILPACPVLAGGSFADGRGCNVFSAPRVRLPAWEVKDIPPDIDAHDFSGALFEHWGIAPSCREEDKRLLINGKDAALPEACDILLRKAGYSPGDF